MNLGASTGTPVSRAAAVRILSHIDGYDVSLIRDPECKGRMQALLTKHKAVILVATTMQEGGDASVAGAGLYSHKLGRFAMTMQER